MKCKVKDCENHTDQGVFVGFLCMPCYTFLTIGEGTYSQLYRNTVAAEREACAALCDEDKNKLGNRGEYLSQFESGCYVTAEFLADAIRARGNDAA
jgi:hypothetical protein